MGSTTVACRVFAGSATLLFLAACGGHSGVTPPSSSGTSPSQARSFIHEPPRPPVPRVKIGPKERAAASAGGWQQITAPAPFGSNGAGTAFLMTDGTVMIQDNTSNWYSLTPAAGGNYVNGTWTQKASMPSGYGPLYYASAVLANGQLIVMGGEYNFFKTADLNVGAIYNPVADAWTPLSGPTGWSQIGDAPSAVLDDGTFMLGSCCSNLQALMPPGTTNWNPTGAGKADSDSEEGFTLLKKGKVLTIDVTNAPNSELYDPVANSWSSAGALPVNLVTHAEIGAQMLRPDGTVFVTGATGATAVYHPFSGAWTTGPTLPVVNGKQLDVADGPATLLPNGAVMFVASPGFYLPPSYYYLYSGGALTQIPGPPNAANDASYNVRLLMLPTGQVLETDGSDDVEIYTPTVKPDTAIAPSITSVSTTLTHGTTYSISGVRFNGFSQENTYGDDAQMAENYPLVRIINLATRHVFYARTHDHSFMGVGSQATVTTNFDVPANIDLGASKLFVVTNGISSAPVSVTIN